MLWFIKIFTYWKIYVSPFHLYVSAQIPSGKQDEPMCEKMCLRVCANFMLSVSLASDLLSV